MGKTCLIPVTAMHPVSGPPPSSSSCCQRRSMCCSAAAIGSETLRDSLIPSRSVIAKFKRDESGEKGNVQVVVAAYVPPPRHPTDLLTALGGSPVGEVRGGGEHLERP